MGRSKWFIRFIWLVCAISLVGLTYEVAQGAEFTLNFAGTMPVQDHTTKGQELFAKVVKEKTGGRVEIKVFPAGQMFSDKDYPTALPTGALDMAAAPFPHLEGLVPSLMVVSLPFYYKDRSHIWRTVDGAAGEILKKDLENVGIKLIYFMDYGLNEFISKKPLRVLEDFKGKNIRGTGLLPTELLKALGASPTYMSGGEVFMALQRGTVDGAISGPITFWERKWYEAAKYVTLGNTFFAIYGVMMNLKKWNSLPADIQTAFLSSANEAQEWSRKQSERSEKECIANLRKVAEVYTLPESERERLKKASELAINVFLNKTGDKGKLLLELVEKAR